eukprot:TRINITY_DN1604_c0_g1_i3.p1 TRINITY_DN1604_c0_g1~~TRINITY_DN1604_c0_g1_i3.p1  ORF type:complete len:359 (-),score=67.23 TRINITY_DN1604_c0_g1_i3:152-1228(-)
MSEGEDCNVKVVVRVRPLNKTEIADGRGKIVTMNPVMGQVFLQKPDSKEPPKNFTFDAAFDENCTQMQVYQETAYPIVQAAIEGYNGTIFAYGQTGTGKTHTMEGVHEVKELRGIIPNSFQHIFDSIALNTKAEYLVCASYLEIYNENVRDLLSKDPHNKLEVKEHPEKGVYVKDLSQSLVKTVQEMDQVMRWGNNNRSVGETKMNATSSRSHSIYTIVLEMSEPSPDGGKPLMRKGKLNLVDLAGSERQSKTGAEGERLTEATKINLSLSALGNVISALVDGKSKHIPYRDSKLTRLLQDSLGGNSKTVMVANMGPADWNYDETLRCGRVFLVRLCASPSHRLRMHGWKVCRLASSF